MFIENLEDLCVLSVADGTKRFLDEALQNLPKYVRREILKHLPILKDIKTRKMNQGYHLSNANFAVALHSFIDVKGSKLSNEAFETIDAWCIVIEGMIRKNRRSNAEELAEISETIARTPKHLVYSICFC